MWTLEKLRGLWSGPAARVGGGLHAVDDELLELGEEEALRRSLDELNLRRLGTQLWMFAAVIALYAIVSYAEGSQIVAILGGLAAAGDLLLLRRRNARFVAGNVRQVCAAVLVLHLVLVQAFHGLGSGGIGIWFVVLALLATRFRLATGEALALIGALYAVTSVRLVGESLLVKEGFPLVALVGFGIVHSGAFGLSWWLTYRHSRRFLARWQAESSRHRDRLRMKRELEYAREIQLSMLPREAPQLPWLQIASLSLPATEVGGDYYDYFRLDEHRLVVVVGDVTGHGVASGLVLSGVRSCLNLLYDELGRPAEILQRVNRMLKRTTAPRMLMTLEVAVLDERRGSLTVATAGHPPVLIARARGGEIEEVGRGSFPLGALYEVKYVEQRVALEPGDLAVMYSDGLVETLNHDGEQFGWTRLHELLARSSDGLTAAEVRDRILREVWDFKGATSQVDDVTMVVMRCSGEHALKT